MFREIRRSERITDTNGKNTERDRLIAELVDCRIGSERYNELKSILDYMDKATKPSAFDPDARV